MLIQSNIWVECLTRDYQGRCSPAAEACGAARTVRGHVVMTIHVANCKFAGRGSRTQTLLLIDERDALLRRGRSPSLRRRADREAARYLRTALLHYRAGAWRPERVRSVPAASCGQVGGTIVGALEGPRSCGV
jgi:hypothetical protein